LNKNKIQDGGGCHWSFAQTAITCEFWGFLMCRNNTVERSYMCVQRLALAKQMLDRLRACVVASYYGRVMTSSSTQLVSISYSVRIA